jgi:hypothetical protein
VHTDPVCHPGAHHHARISHERRRIAWSPDASGIHPASGMPNDRQSALHHQQLTLDQVEAG